MREQLERLVSEMVSKGILYEDAHREFERRFIQVALDSASGSISRAAELTGLHRNTLRRKVCEYGLTTNSGGARRGSGKGRRGKGRRGRGKGVKG